MTTALLILAGLTFVYALCARRLAEGVVTPPMVFLAMGLGALAVCPLGPFAMAFAAPLGPIAALLNARFRAD